MQENRHDDQAYSWPSCTIGPVILQEAKEAHLTAKIEKGAGDTGARPGGVFIPAWKCDRLVMMNIKVAAALRKIKAARSALKPREANRLRRIEKTRKREQGCLSHGLGFAPMAGEALGGWAPDPLDAIRLLAEKMARASRSRKKKLQHSVFSTRRHEL